MNRSRCLWLDADRSEGETLVRVTAEGIAEAQSYLSEHPGTGPLTVLGEPYSLMSQRPFFITALGVTLEDGDRPFGGLSVIRGEMMVLDVWIGELLGAPFPTRVRNPPRQNLSFRVVQPGCPMEIRLSWRHMER